MAQWLEIGIAQVNEIPTFVSRVLPHIRKKKGNRAATRFPFHLNCYASVFGPAATKALPAALPSYFTKFLMKRSARSFAFLFHSSLSA